MSGTAATNNANGVAVSAALVNSATINTNSGTSSFVANVATAGRGALRAGGTGPLPSSNPVLANPHMVNPNGPYTTNPTGGGGGGTIRSKPRPLELSISSQPLGVRCPDRGVPFGGAMQCPNEEMPIYEILNLMEQINRAVRANEFSAYLGTQILRLVVHLKKFGLAMETSYQKDLNHVFVSLRQACCRDAGQLGTVCRLEMMELIELRAMGWKPNLSHSRYYMKRSYGSIANQELNSADGYHSTDADQFPTAPESAPPFGTVAINPFAFNFAGGAPIASAADLSSLPTTAGMSGATPYFLIPASPLTHNQASIAFISPTTNVLAQPVNAKPLAQAMYQPAPLGTQSPPSAGSKQGSKATAKSTRSTKSSSKTICRAEIVIRNADSGKVMGVKGRRVAVIEEMSNTIQRCARCFRVNVASELALFLFEVTPNMKDRMITINGPTEEAIEMAKKLIEETIRRNVSPDRVKNGNGRGNTFSYVNFSASVESEDDVTKGKSNQDAESEVEIVTGDNGEMLKLISPNPQLLQTACKALDFYFKSQRNTNEAGCTAVDADGQNSKWKINRRKSLSSLNDSSNAMTMKAPLDLQKTVVIEDVKGFANRSSGAAGIAQQKLCARSTPNLMEKFDELFLEESESGSPETGSKNQQNDGKAKANNESGVSNGVDTCSEKLTYSRQTFIDLVLSAPSSVLASDFDGSLASWAPEIVRQTLV
ncbi:KH 1 domain containing protein [Trichuris trichiura]|uniref:KH 1 domain containing protein n=1 Tax=Trichuris trichiura TaxID=36087 RepID=A0A077ZA00_TRITR|nr:KH 1 domain containing protein [Trichuris trichiura]